MPNFGKIGASFRALARKSRHLNFLWNSYKGKEPKSLGEGLFRVKRAMKGTGADVAQTQGERAYRTTDGTFVRMSLFNIKLNAQPGVLGQNGVHDRQVGTALRVIRPKRQPLDNQVYGFTRLRYLSQTPTNKPSRVQYTMAHKPNTRYFSWPSQDGYNVKDIERYTATKAQVKAMTSKPDKTHTDLPVIRMTRTVREHGNGEKDYLAFFKFSENREAIRGW